MKTYYTAEEAIKRLDLPNSTFHYLVRKGQIPKIVFPLRKQAVYPKAEIDKIVEQKTKMLEDMQSDPNRLEFVIPNHSDLQQLINIEEAYYHEETIIPVEAILARLKYSPENIHILKDKETNKVVGSITMSVLNPKVLEKLINLEIDETEIKLEDYKDYSLGDNDCYIVSIVANPCTAEKYYASRLLHTTMEYLEELLERGIKIRKIYTVAATKEGDKLAQKMGFSLLKEGDSKLEDFRHSYVLNLEEKQSKSKLVSQYIKMKKNRERRTRRQQAKT